MCRVMFYREQLGLLIMENWFTPVLVRTQCSTLGYPYLKQNICVDDFFLFQREHANIYDIDKQ